MDPVWSNCSDAAVKISCRKLHKVHNIFPADTYWLPTDAALTPFVPPNERKVENDWHESKYLSPYVWMNCLLGVVYCTHVNMTVRVGSFLKFSL